MTGAPAGGISRSELDAVLNEIAQLVTEARDAGWASEPDAERAALNAAQAQLVQLHDALAARNAELDHVVSTGEPADTTSNTDRVVEEWNLGSHALAGTRRFVTPDEFRAGVPDHVRHSRVTSVVVDALAAAADNTGVITAFTLNEFYENHIASVLNIGRLPGETAWPLRFDKFTSMMLNELLGKLLVVDKLFAIRENGDALDYRLMLPT